MGKNSILKKHHRKFLELVLKEPYILKRFYWTGGTVLAEFYLKHRESYDIDLFTEAREVHAPSINKFVSLVAKKLGARKMSFKKFFGLYSYRLELPSDVLKVDFNYYPFARINKGKKWNSLEIDSLEDIAANKLHTIYTKARDRDFVDLYFILKQEKYDLKKLIILAKTKFDWHIDPVQLGLAFAKVVLVKDFPKMLVPFDRKQMEQFFLKEAKNLGKQIFK